MHSLQLCFKGMLRQATVNVVRLFNFLVYSALQIDLIVDTVCNMAAETKAGSVDEIIAALEAQLKSEVEDIQLAAELIKKAKEAVKEELGKSRILCYFYNNLICAMVL